MATKDDLLKELNWVTEKISSLLWTINLSVLGTTWTLLLGAAPAIPERLKLQSITAIPILALCIGSMVFELGQYLTAYYNNRQALRALEGADQLNFKYDTASLSYRLRFMFFYLKISFALLAATILLAQLIQRI